MQLTKGGDAYRGALFRPTYDRGFWHRFDVEPFEPTETHEVVVEAFVNEGRWLVQCPNPLCGGAQLAHPDDHRFFCVDCLNLAFDGKWLAVRWPKNAATIERVLVQRPYPVTRNWSPGETVDDLERENDERGVR